MFFRKAKRIKELEKENEELQRLINRLRASRLCDEPYIPRALEIETVNAIGSYPEWYGLDFMECEIKHELFSELCPFIKIEKSFSEADGKHLLRASLRIVKER